jgi:hypothetical protein
MIDHDSGPSELDFSKYGAKGNNIDEKNDTHLPLSLILFE